METGKRARGSLLRGVLGLAVVLGALLVFAGPALAVERIKVEVGGETCYRDPYGELVCPEDIERDFDTEVEAEVLERGGTPDSPLPFTGADVTLFVITGAALVATGVVVVRRTRASRIKA